MEGGEKGVDGGRKWKISARETGVKLNEWCEGGDVRIG